MPISTDENATRTWDEIQSLVDEIAELVESETSAERFHETALRRLREVTHAEEVVAWVPADGEYRAAHACGGTGPRTAESRLLDEVLATRRAVRAEGTGDAARVLCPVHAGDEPVGVLEVVQSDSTPPAARRSTTQVVEAVAELVGDFRRNRLLVELRERDRDAEARREFCHRVVGGGSLDEVAFAVAHEGRAYVGCDRLSVLEQRGRRWRVVAVSGATRVESRARAVRHLERLATTMLAVDSDFQHIDGREPNEPRPPEVTNALDSYLGESSARVVHLARLESDAGGASFAIVGERFDLVDADETAERVRRLAPEARLALHAARRPSLLKRVAGAGLAWGLLAFVVIAAGVLTFVEADFTVPARGTIEPAERRRLFAPRTTFVRQLHTDYGSDVAAGATVVELVDPELDLEAERIAGEIETVSLQIAAAELARVPGFRTTDGGLDASARAEELEKVRTSLVERRRLIERERRALVVRSPIAGRVVTWDLDQRLHDRPIERGDLLLEVARFDGPWRLRLDVPDDEFGHLRDTRSNDEGLRVEYALATEPESMHEATIDRIAMTTDLDRDGEAIVRAEVRLEPTAVPVARPGATVVARIHCGRRPLGYVWFHEALHAVRTWWYR